jgi:hypothetical protein
MIPCRISQLGYVRNMESLESVAQEREGVAGGCATRYVRIGWRHEGADEPVVLYSELDGKRREIRRVEVFRDGSMGYACAAFERGGSRLGKMAMPTLAELAQDPTFDPAEVTAHEFETMWVRAVRCRRLETTAHRPA